MKLPRLEDLQVANLGPCNVDSPVHSRGERCIDDDCRVLSSQTTNDLAYCAQEGIEVPSFEAAGPRRRLYFEPRWITCGIVTCGGLCPGVNDVIRAIVMTLIREYGVPRILGFRFGYAGLAGDMPLPPLELNPDNVDDIHNEGGTMLGSSRGPQDVGEMVDTLVKLGVRILFTIGGDGTLRGASALAAEIARRDLKIAVVGIPKTIDNDIECISRSFGFATAVEEARRVITAAHSEAEGAWRGVGIVKLMGRHSGFIAAHATLANSDVNFCLVPEIPFALEGERGLLATLRERLERKHHAVIVVAEGAGQELLRRSKAPGTDASGNLRLGDIGTFLRDAINADLGSQHFNATVKYIDPSYIIRSLPANALDSELCLTLGQHAAHAGMAGRTNLIVGLWNERFTHVPIEQAIRSRKQLDTHGSVWHRVLEATGQPAGLS
ncbi:MAG: ATP-dependent 6-phosphofructokinase [Polyangiales bacterium]